MRMRLSVFLYAKTNIGIYWEAFQSLCAFLSSLAYIISTYDSDCLLFGSTVAEMSVELSLLFFFILDYILNFYLAAANIAHLFSWMTIVDTMSIIPTMYQYILVATNPDRSIGCDSGGFMYIKFIRLVRVLRVLRALRPLMRVFRLGQSDVGVWPHVATITTTVGVVVLVSACLFQYVETLCYASGDWPEELQFHFVMYWMLIEVLGRPRIPVSTWMGTVPNPDANRLP